MLIPCDLQSVFWGKLKLNSSGEGQKRELVAYLPLSDHCLDVSVVFLKLAHLPAIRRSLNVAAGQTLCNIQLQRLAVFALLHDFGKANLGFQDKPFSGNQVGHLYETAPLLLVEELVQKLIEVWDLPNLSAWFDQSHTLSSYLLATLSHHGKPVRLNELEQHLQREGGVLSRYWHVDGERDPFIALTKLINTAGVAYPDAFAKDAELLPSNSELQHRFLGLLMLADWLGSNELFFPIDNGVSERYQLAITRAEQSLHVIGLNASDCQQQLIESKWCFESLFEFSPYPLQHCLDQLDVRDSSHRLLIAEAETGSGKTEAAIVRFLRLFEEQEVDGLYFALPTKVAARELYERVNFYINNAFPDPRNRPVVLLAVPRYCKVDGQNIDALPIRLGRCFDEKSQSAYEGRNWAAEHPKRFLAATIAVGTIDQALLSAIQTNHAHMRSICLDRQLLVVDEVHSSDRYMRTLLTLLLSHHLQRSHALLLSATLGSEALCEFIRLQNETVQTPKLEEAKVRAYPALTNGYSEALLNEVPSVSSKPVFVEQHPCMFELGTIISEIEQALKQGARVLVIMNTVDRALTIQRQVERVVRLEKDVLFSCNGVIAPHHGRYCPDDRRYLDAEVTRLLGKKSGPGPRLLVGTQTLEQSLDIDADLLITDLCPMDVLLQRIGRLHRHAKRKDKGWRPLRFERARCVLLTPSEDNLHSMLFESGEVNGFAMKAGLGSVYADMRILQRTWDTLTDKPKIEIPKDNRYLVEMATHPESLAKLIGSEWQKHGVGIVGGDTAQQARAGLRSLISCYGLPFGDFHFDDLNENVRTRLGMNTLQLPLPEVMQSPFAVDVNEVVIPGHMAPKDALGHSNDLNIQNVEPLAEGGFSFQSENKSYCYTRFGLEVRDESAH